MTLRPLVSEALKEWAEEARIPPDLADRALRGRRHRTARRSGTMALAAAATAAIVTGGMLAPRLLDGTPPAATDPASPAATSPASPAPTYPAPTPVDTGAPVPVPREVTPAELPASLDVHTDTGDSPPKKLIAAGRIAVAAYYVSGTEKIGKNSDRAHSTWYLYDPGTGSYEETGWSQVDVAPGLKYAAVLERDLPARRVGILDMATRQVRWIALPQPATDVAWSPDGSRILVTSFDQDPSVRIDISADGNSWKSSPTRRLGFHIVDAASGQVAFHRGASGADGLFDATPFRWSLDGTLVIEPNPAAQRPPAEPGGEPVPNELFYDLDGRLRPPSVQDVGGTYQAAYSSGEAGYSPGGRLYSGRVKPKIPEPARTYSGEELERPPADPGPLTEVLDVATGQVVGRQKMLQVNAWADDGHLIGWQCLGECEDEFDARLALVSLDGSKIVRLSGEARDSQKYGSWHPLLTRR
ncbi:hypothetical protein Sru01_28610 [Sphaerisporangium rufum]|uniref:WD40 repeat domain-containing protein n=1 Tax=Sphaerisporangium rufum TaxID=1381558 RepID=A0A919UZL4_9ACTN|nr:hypothetical protein [Sphaerisporangium rufum]GII77879.1 hypothetical protein Sru01_28610 [Sphaerisporangium rufum]